MLEGRADSQNLGVVGGDALEMHFSSGEWTDVGQEPNYAFWKFGKPQCMELWKDDGAAYGEAAVKIGLEIGPKAQSH